MDNLIDNVLGLLIIGGYILWIYFAIEGIIRLFQRNVNSGREHILRRPVGMGLIVAALRIFGILASGSLHGPYEPNIYIAFGAAVFALVLIAAGLFLIAKRHSILSRLARFLILLAVGIPILTATILDLHI